MWFEALADRLREEGHRLAPQRVALMRLWASSGGHPLAADLCGQLRARFPTTSLATVYKTLNLLLTAGCWVRSSQRLHDWLLHHRWFGGYVRYYVAYRAVRPRARGVTLVLLWGVMGATALTAVTSWWIRALLGIVAIGVTVHLLQLKSLTPEMQQSNRGCLKGGDA